MQAFQDEDLQRDSYDGIGLLRAIQAQDWPWRGEFLMAAFQIDVGVCADESGIQESAPLCIIAGYMASIKQWLWFDERWYSVLEKHDVEDFHSKNFFAFENGQRVGTYRRRSNRNGRGSYGDWSEYKIQDFIGGLLEAISVSRIYPLGAYVDTEVFFSFTYGERKYLTGGKLDRSLKWVNSGAPSKPYFLLFDHCLGEAGHRTRPGKKALFVFDQQKEFEGRALQQFGESILVLSKARDAIADRLGGVLFQNRVAMPGLQAADLYTHCWYRHIGKNEVVGPRIEALERLTEKDPAMKKYTKEHMSGLFRTLPPDVRAFVRDYPEPQMPTSVERV